MSDLIHIDASAIKERVSNALILKSILDAYEVPTSELIQNCTGRVPEQLNRCLVEAKIIHVAMQALLNNTIAWCKTVQINFETTDKSYGKEHQHELQSDP